MKRERIDINLLEENIGQIEGVPSNPRQWTAQDVEDIAKSLKETPELFEARGCIVYPQGGRYIVIGGNLRLQGSMLNCDKDVPCIILPEDITAKTLRQIVIKDNVSKGQWDFEALNEEWGDEPLGEWGVPVFSFGEGLPDELQGLDITPDELAELQGEDETARQHIVITYDEDSRWKVEQVFGIEDATSKVVWTIEEIFKQREDRK